jgi:cubilin
MALSSEPVPLTDGSGRYIRNMRCEWQLSGSGTIELVMASLDLDEGDELVVYDGPNSSSPLLAALSGVASDLPDLPEPIQSSGGSMTVVFTSDETVQREGFVVTVRSVPAATPSPTVVGHTSAPTTAAPTGPCHMHVRRVASGVPHMVRG